jgi:hypothetical protein
MAIKPTVKTNWATGGQALKEPTDSARWGYGWSTKDNIPSGSGEPPNLNQQNYWQNAVHEWVEYVEESLDTQSIEIDTITYEALDVRSVLWKASIDVWSYVGGTTGDTFRCVCWSPELSLFCAVGGYSGYSFIRTSPDGVTWTSRTPSTQCQWQGVCWSPELGLFCAVGPYSTGVDLRVSTSPDGINWTSASVPYYYAWRSVCWSPELGLFCVVGDNVVATSSDGVNWSIVSVSGYWSYVCWSPELGLFCAVKGLGTTAGISSDGVNWSYVTIPKPDSSYTWGAIDWSPTLGLFFAVNYGSNNSPMYSYDGINWQLSEAKIPSGARNTKWSEELGVFIIVTASSKIMYSDDGNRAWAGIFQPSVIPDGACWSKELRIFCLSSSNTSGVQKFYISS